MEENKIKRIVTEVVENYKSLLETDGGEDTSFPVEASARHVHLTREAVSKLFGEGSALMKKRDLTLPGFLAEQRVAIVTAKGVFHNVAVLGPERDAIQVELSKSDARSLGVDPPVNISGDLTGAADVYLVGESGMVWAKGSAIVAKAHVHMSREEAGNYGVKDGQTVDVSVLSRRPVTFSKVPVRVNEGMRATLHIDVDEANACGFVSGTRGKLLVNSERQAQNENL